MPLLPCNCYERITGSACPPVCPTRAAGIGVHESFNHNSTTALYVEGILDSLSTGILIYVVLVELINPMMTQVRKGWGQQASGVCGV